MNREFIGEYEKMGLRWISLLCTGTLMLWSSTSVIAQNSAHQEELTTVQQELQNAKQAVEDARRAAEQIVLDAQREAALIRHSSPDNQHQPLDLEPIEIQNSKIAVEIAAGTVEEIATAIMPSDWRILVDVKDQSLLQRRFQFVSTKSRDQALRDLLKPVGLQCQYFFDLKDPSGGRSPLLVISKI